MSNAEASSKCRFVYPNSLYLQLHQLLVMRSAAFLGAKVGFNFPGNLSEILISVIFCSTLAR